MRAARVLETSVYATNLETTAAFYRDVIGLAFYSQQPGRHVFFRCGDGMLLVFNPTATQVADGRVGVHGASGPGHVAFAATLDDIPDWRRHFQAHGVVVEQDVTWPSGGQSLYVRDPAGNSVELATPTTWPYLRSSDSDARDSC